MGEEDATVESLLREILAELSRCNARPCRAVTPPVEKKTDRLGHTLALTESRLDGVEQALASLWQAARHYSRRLARYQRLDERRLQRLIARTSDR